MTQFFTDSDTDVTLAEARDMGFELISMPYSIDGQTTYPYKDFEDFDSKKFYDMLREGVLPTTSAISEEAYIEYFEPVFKRGDDILYVHFSAAMTITFDNMKKAVNRLKKQYPERKFYDIDTKGITTISYAIVKDIADLKKAGKTPEEIVNWAKTEVDHYAMYFFADDLKFFKRSGRVSGLAATMGTIVGIRPIIHMSQDGKMESIGKERGRSKAIETLVDYVESLGLDIKQHRIVIGHSDALDLVDEIIDALRRRFGDDLRIEYKTTNPTAGSHCGPNGAGICFHAIHR
ncbi:MAG: DegV family protein [Treponema sp.]|nr:DegV family protein [Treponema sp.]